MQQDQIHFTTYIAEVLIKCDFSVRCFQRLS